MLYFGLLEYQNAKMIDAKMLKCKKQKFQEAKMQKHSNANKLITFLKINILNVIKCYYAKMIEH